MRQMHQVSPVFATNQSHKWETQNIWPGSACLEDGGVLLCERKTFSRRSLILWKLTLWMRNLLSCNLVSLWFILSESERGYNSRIKSVYGEGGFLIWNLSWEEQWEQKEVLHFKKSGRESERWETTCWPEAETSLETDHTGFSCTLLPRQNTLENVLKTCPRVCCCLSGHIAPRVRCYLSGHIALRRCKTLHCLEQSSFEKTSAVSRVACTMRHTEAAVAPASSYHPGHSKGDLSSWSPGNPQQRTAGTTFTEGGPPLL